MSLASSSAWAGGRVPEGPARGWKGGIAGRSPVVRGADRPWKVCPVISAGEEGLLAFGGGCPCGVCGEGHFWPLLGGVKDIVGEEKVGFCSGSKIGRWWLEVKRRRGPVVVWMSFLVVVPPLFLSRFLYSCHLVVCARSLHSPIYSVRNPHGMCGIPRNSTES